MDTYQRGLEVEADNEELQEGMSRCMDALDRFMSGQVSEEELALRREKAMADPEIQARSSSRTRVRGGERPPLPDSSWPFLDPQNILMDPIMRTVLKDFQENPRAAQNHLKDPVISMKLGKLVRSGIVRMG